MPTIKEQLEASQKAVGEFFELSNYVLNDDAPLKANEIPSDNKYHETARQMAEDLEIDWETMTSEESSRVMINLLADYFCNISTVEGYKPILSIKFAKD